MRWNTDKIMSDLKTLDGVKNIKNLGQGGDVDSDNIVLHMDDDSGDHIFICGFVTDGDITTPGDCDIEMVEMTDGTDSRGGLQSRNKLTRRVFHVIEDYFVDGYGVQVVPTLKDYF